MGSNWSIADKIKVQVANYSPAGTTIYDPTSSTVTTVINNAHVTLSGTWTSTIDTATFTISSIPAGLVNQTLTVRFSLSYPAASLSEGGLSATTDEFYSVFDPVASESVPFSSGQPYRLRKTTSRVVNSYTDTIYDKSLLAAETRAISGVSVCHYHLDGGNTNIYTVPSTIEGAAVSSVYQVFDMSGPAPTLLAFTDTLNNDGSLSVELGSIRAAGTTLRFVVALQGSSVQLSGITKSLEEMGEVVSMTTTLSGATSWNLDLGGLALGYQGRQVPGVGGDPEVKGRIYLDGEAKDVTVQIDPRQTSKATLTFSSLTGTAKAYFVRAKTLPTTAQMQIAYRRAPYFGTFLWDQNGAIPRTFTNSPFDPDNLQLKIILSDRKIYHCSSGTGGLRAMADGTPAILSSLLERLPFRHSGGATIASFESEELSLVSGTPQSDLISQPLADHNLVSSAGVSALTPWGTVSFSDFGSLVNTGNFSANFPLSSTANHVNFSFLLCQVLKTQREYKILKGELVLLVVSQTVIEGDETSIDWISNPDDCLWDIFQLPGRPLLPIF